MTAHHSEPPPTPPPGGATPPGPGVRPPFAAPPVRKQGGKLALALVLGSVGAVVCLIAAAAIFGGVMYQAFQDTDQEAKAAVSQYLDALRDQSYRDAYQLTCRAHRKEVPEAEYVANRRESAPLRDYRLGTIQAPAGQAPPGAYAVPARLQFADGTMSNFDFVVVRERVRPKSGPASSEEFAFRVCGEQQQRPAPSPS
ncbi:MAG: hypothetical protein ACRDT8_14085 [Micromonosporaceae bacterium]